MTGPRVTTTTHDPGAVGTVTTYPDRDAALAEIDRWADRHRAHGCSVEWLPHGRVVARHYRMPVAAVAVIELAPAPTPKEEEAPPEDLDHTLVVVDHPAHGRCVAPAWLAEALDL